MILIILFNRQNVTIKSKDMYQMIIIDVNNKNNDKYVITGANTSFIKVKHNHSHNGNDKMYK